MLPDETGTERWHSSRRALCIVTLLCALSFIIEGIHFMTQPSTAPRQVSGRRYGEGDTLTQPAGGVLMQAAAAELVTPTPTPSAAPRKWRPTPVVTYSVLTNSNVEGLLLLFAAAHLRHLVYIRGDYESLWLSDRQRYKVGNIQNPCYYYASLYSQGVSRKRNPSEEHGPLAEVDIAREKRAFQKWLRFIISGTKAPEHDVKAGPGLASLRFAADYSYYKVMPKKSSRSFSVEDLQTVNAFLADFNTSSINCWIKRENLLEDAHHCFERIEEEAGLHVNWAGVDRVAKTQGAVLGDSILMPCVGFYDNETANLVRSADAHLFRLFNYTSCC
eukprot:NODE_11850_length_1261_cov_17.105820.p1 GENE.NODE_11850_length_1261_cov_17.105820~~NODE_11850_length_1261_cov_17.105820.p1  ORF type:complete len:331 (-),score=57.96 NODE_11850_length_1261_cov_17.105820:191-1183(-)